MKTKRQLLKEFNKVQKEYIEAVRLKNHVAIVMLANEREYIRMQIRRIENAEKK